MNGQVLLEAMSWLDEEIVQCASNTEQTSKKKESVHWKLVCTLIAIMVCVMSIFIYIQEKGEERNYAGGKYIYGHSTIHTIKIGRRIFIRDRNAVLPQSVLRIGNVNDERKTNAIAKMFVAVADREELIGYSVFISKDNRNYIYLCNEQECILFVRDVVSWSWIYHNGDLYLYSGHLAHLGVFNEGCIGKSEKLGVLAENAVLLGEVEYNYQNRHVMPSGELSTNDSVIAGLKVYSIPNQNDYIVVEVPNGWRNGTRYDRYYKVAKEDIPD